MSLSTMSNVLRVSETTGRVRVSARLPLFFDARDIVDSAGHTDVFFASVLFLVASVRNFHVGAGSHPLTGDLEPVSRDHSLVVQFRGL